MTNIFGVLQIWDDGYLIVRTNTLQYEKYALHKWGGSSF